MRLWFPYLNNKRFVFSFTILHKCQNLDCDNDCWSNEYDGKNEFVFPKWNP